MTAKFLQGNEAKKKESFWVQFALSIVPTLLTCAVYNYFICTGSLQEATERVLADFLLLIPFKAKHTGIDSSSIMTDTPFQFIAMCGQDYFELRDTTTQLWPYMATTLLYKIAFLYCTNQANDLREKFRDVEHF